VVSIAEEKIQKEAIQNKEKMDELRKKKESMEKEGEVNDYESFEIANAMQKYS